MHPVHVGFMMLAWHREWFPVGFRSGPVITHHLPFSSKGGLLAWARYMAENIAHGHRPHRTFVDAMNHLYSSAPGDPRRIWHVRVRMLSHHGHREIWAAYIVHSGHAQRLLRFKIGV